MLARRGMTAWQQWIHRPQNLWLRKVFFQIHLWLGIAVGLYVVVISISGSAIVFRRELGRQELRRTMIVAESGRSRIAAENLRELAQKYWPSDQVLSVLEPLAPDRPDVVVIERRGQRVERLFNPYTGADLGDRRSGMDRILGWLEDLHDNLLGGLTGRTWNGLGALLVTLLSLTGTIVWWPGIKNWRRSLTINRRARFARLNWDLHSAVGFWCSLFVLIWGISGIGLCFPGTLDFVLGSEVRIWLNRLHFGRFDLATEVLWTFLGLAPAVLAVTGALMWWNRVLSKKVRRLANRSAQYTGVTERVPAGLRKHAQPVRSTSDWDARQ